jgi:Protein of unknown function (DUF229)
MKNTQLIRDDKENTSYHKRAFCTREDYTIKKWYVRDTFDTLALHKMCFGTVLFIDAVSFIVASHKIYECVLFEYSVCFSRGAPPTLYSSIMGILILLYVYILTLLVVSGESTYCKFGNVDAFPAPHHAKPINIAEYNDNCLRAPPFNAAINHGILTIEGCQTATYQYVGSDTWHSYNHQVPLKDGDAVHVSCDGSSPILLINPPSPHNVKAPSSRNPSVFVVMLDAISYEALHRLMPYTVDMLKNHEQLDVFEFTKYHTTFHTPLTSLHACTTYIHFNPLTYTTRHSHSYSSPTSNHAVHSLSQTKIRHSRA